MSTYWNIECRRCGLEVFKDSYGWSNHLGPQFSKLCASGILSTSPRHAGAWRIGIISEVGDEDVDPGRLDTGCTHDFEPRNEYGDWAKPEMWPDWHPKSQVIEGTQPTDCSGLGEVRCIG